jgi:hypothetical protein
MKLKAFIGLVILSICFILGGLYITEGMNLVVGKLQDIILLQQMHFQRKALADQIKEVQTDLLLKDSPHAVNFDTFVLHGEEAASPVIIPPIPLPANSATCDSFLKVIRGS